MMIVLLFFTSFFVPVENGFVEYEVIWKQRNVINNQWYPGYFDSNKKVVYFDYWVYNSTSTDKIGNTIIEHEYLHILCVENKRMLFHIGGIYIKSVNWWELCFPSNDYHSIKII